MLFIEMLAEKDEPDHYIVVIHWTSKDDHPNGFRKGGEFMEFFKLVKPFYNNTKEMKHYNLTDIGWKKSLIYPCLVGQETKGTSCTTKTKMSVRTLTLA